jgi:hypothetical protein
MGRSARFRRPGVENAPVAQYNERTPEIVVSGVRLMILDAKAVTTPIKPAEAIHETPAHGGGGFCVHFPS